MRVLFPGSFDPVSNGHLDLIGRLALLADSIVVAVAINPAKHPLFTEEERVEMLRIVCHTWPQVEVYAFHGLVVEAARQVNAACIVRGTRGGAECDHELQMAQMNRTMAGIETLFLPASPQWAF